MFIFPCDNMDRDGCSLFRQNNRMKGGRPVVKKDLFERNINTDASASIPPDVRKKIIQMDQDEKAKRMTKRPQ